MATNHNGWNHFGFAAKDAISLSTTLAVHELTEDTSVKRSNGVPDDCHLYDILFELSAMNTSGATPSQVSFYLARDVAGAKPLTEIFTVNIVKTLGAASATGGATKRVEIDFHATPGVGPAAYNSIYVIAAVDQSTATATAYLSWRG